MGVHGPGPGRHPSMWVGRHGIQLTVHARNGLTYRVTAWQMANRLPPNHRSPDDQGENK
jgi:hypothetical protein